MTAKNEAIEHIKSALETGVRGEVREYLRKALKAAEGRRVAGLTVNDYNHLPVTAKLMDPDRPGLTMRHGKRTGKVWIYRRKLHGHVVETQFGTFPKMSVADARILWGDLREADRTGKSIKIVLGDNAPAERGLTMGELVDLYLEQYAKKFKRSWAMDATYLRKHILEHYERLPVAQFTSDTVRAILAPIAERAPREAEKVRGVLSSMFNVARRGNKKLGNLKGSTWLPPDSPNPAEGVILPARETQQHTPTTAELATLMRELKNEPLGDAILFQALTCARVTEVTALPFAEIDFDAGIWRLPAERSKNGKAHNVMLPTQAVALLKQRRAEISGPFVFPGAKGSPHTSRNAIAKAINRICARTDIPASFTSHALRHGCLTWLAESGAGKDIRDRVSNHSSNDGSADSIYNAAQLNQPAREWLQRWAGHLESLNQECGQ